MPDKGHQLGFTLIEVVVAMAVVLWSRYRHSRPTDALGLVVRFSSVASVALAAVVVAGVIMAIAQGFNHKLLGPFQGFSLRDFN